MALSCKHRLLKVEQNVLQPIDNWVTQQEEKCKNEPCNWWTLCLNKLFCWIVVTVVKIVTWVLTTVVRWLYQIVCVAVSLVIGLVTLPFQPQNMVQALNDFWGLAKDVFYFATGAVIFIALRIVDAVQSLFKMQGAKRALTEAERGILRMIFRDSLNYNAISIIDGRAGVLGISGRAFTMGFNIYMPNYRIETLVHECIHVWQYQFEGTKYIGQSAFMQLDRLWFTKTYDPYAWVNEINRTQSWYLLKSVEAQAKFIEDVFTSKNGAQFIFLNKSIPPDSSDGAFFREDPDLGRNRFVFNSDGIDYTSLANDAWKILRAT